MDEQALFEEYKRLQSYNYVANQEVKKEDNSDKFLNMSLKKLLTDVANTLYALIDLLFDPSRWTYNEFVKFITYEYHLYSLGVMLIIFALFVILATTTTTTTTTTENV